MSSAPMPGVPNATPTSNGELAAPFMSTPGATFSTPSSSAATAVTSAPLTTREAMTLGSLTSKNRPLRSATLAPVCDSSKRMPPSACSETFTMTFGTPGMAN